MSDSTIPKVGDIVAEKYRIVGIVGEGGMGTVLSATHVITQKRFAIKWMHKELALDSDYVQRFILEAQAVGRINHPNVIDIYDVEIQNGAVFLVMEFLYGEPLTALLSRQKPKIAEIVRLLLPALRGVAAAHSQGVIHRDIKPDNIFLCRSPEGRPREAKVLDFGISRVADQNGQLNPRLTQTGTLMGTPHYMSPEQVRGDVDVGVQADIYAFGVILYQAITGRLPFDASTFGALAMEIATRNTTKPTQIREELPVELEAVIMKAMARKPEDRYPDIESLARVLEPFSEEAYFESTPTNPTISLNVKDQRQSETSDTPITTETAVSEIPIRYPKDKPRALAIIVGAISLALLVGGVWTAFTLLEGAADRTKKELRPADAPLKLENIDLTKPAVDTNSPRQTSDLKETRELERSDKTASLPFGKDAEELADNVDRGSDKTGKEKRVFESRRKQSDRKSKRKPTTRSRKTIAPEQKSIRSRTGSLRVDEF